MTDHRTKLKQTEVDCEYLKTCCETLTEENKRLQKELQELRALKTSQPFYMQLPATTLNMCPSCERVVTSTSPTTPASKTTALPQQPANGCPWYLQQHISYALKQCILVIFYNLQSVTDSGQEIDKHNESENVVLRLHLCICKYKFAFFFFYHVIIDCCL